MALVRSRYGDFGPTPACEYLAEQHGVVISRQLLAAAGLWEPKPRTFNSVHV